MVKVRENRVPMMLSDEELTAIDDWRFQNRVATRSDAIRRLCKLAVIVDKRSNNVQTLNWKAKSKMAALAESMKIPEDLGDDFASLMLKDFQATSVIVHHIEGKQENDPIKPVLEAYVAALLAVNDLSRSVMELSDAADTIRSPKKLAEVSDLVNQSQALYDRMLGREINPETDERLNEVFDRPQFAARNKDAE